MKKIITVLLLYTLCVTLSSCWRLSDILPWLSNGAPDSSSKEESAGSAAETGPGTAGLPQDPLSLGEEPWATMEEPVTEQPGPSAAVPTEAPSAVPEAEPTAKPVTESTPAPAETPGTSAPEEIQFPIAP